MGDFSEPLQFQLTAVRETVLKLHIVSWIPEWTWIVYSSLQQIMMCMRLAAAAQLVGCSEHSCKRLHGGHRPETKGFHRCSARHLMLTPS